MTSSRERSHNHNNTGAPPSTGLETDPAALAIEGLETCYGRKIILDDISLSVPTGSVFGLIGLNGAGKTTLIKSALNLVPIRKGSIRLFAKNHHLAGARKDLVFLPEQFLPSPYLTGMEFLKISLAYYQQPFAKDLATEWANKLALDPKVLKQRVTSYSKGMCQKLGLAASLMSNRRLMILDEPMSGLDPLARARLKDALNTAHQEGRTIFLSSHILADMDELCDQIALIHQGRLTFIGPPAELKQQTQAPSLERAVLHAIES